MHLKGHYYSFDKKHHLNYSVRNKVMENKCKLDACCTHLTRFGWQRIFDPNYLALDYTRKLDYYTERIMISTQSVSIIRKDINFCFKTGPSSCQLHLYLAYFSNISSTLHVTRREASCFLFSDSAVTMGTYDTQRQSLGQCYASPSKVSCHGNVILSL